MEVAKCTGTRIRQRLKERRRREREIERISGGLGLKREEKTHTMGVLRVLFRKEVPVVLSSACKPALPHQDTQSNKNVYYCYCPFV